MFLEFFSIIVLIPFVGGLLAIANDRLEWQKDHTYPKHLRIVIDNTKNIEEKNRRLP
ncbi:hypothetical protein [Halobacillus salinus]|uniref:hypothetical protein n=1 Tax=Halobacillus salinus TaxID=192814 RepID=UPI0013052FE8|nr:hypothetical protein [Halobacillus salinus]